MPSQFPSEKQTQAEAFGRKHRTGLVTLLFTDMVDSTALKEQLGDGAASDLFRKHHALIRETLRQFPHGEEIETAGDSFLLIFATPSDAVEFALLAQARLRSLRPETTASALDRIGIHVGEVVVSNETESRKPKDLFGIQIDTCSRVMSLAKAGQTLMTRSVFDSARQVLKGEDVQGVGSLEWLNHGPYLLKGLEEPVEICEVREAGREAGGPPISSEKAQRQVRADEEPVLGWRPAVSQIIPNTRWILEKKLGQGGFGEVWLGRNSTTKQARVFKFCFQAERVRFLKREMTLFRVLKERIGDHPNIVRLNDVYLEQPPFYVEMEYVEGADLRSWCEEHGGAAVIPFETRLEIVAQAADGLQAAHEAGIVHRDIKPANILIGGKGTGPTEVRVKLTDFGIGQVVSEEYLKGITRAGFTQTMAGESSSGTGTHLYMAPELLGGKPASIRSDIYSLGVVLYQVLVGDFGRPITTDWAKDIADPLLRDDLRHCFAGNPQERFVGAGQLAKNLRELPVRRAELKRREAENAAVERAAYRRGMMRTAAVAAVIVVVISGLAIVAFNQSRRAKAAARREKQERLRAERHLYIAHINLAQQAWEQNNIERVRQLLKETSAYPERGFEWFYWQRQTHLELMILRGHAAPILALAYSPDGQRIITGSGDNTAKVWDAASGQDLFTLRGHTGPVRSVAFSPDGQRIVTGSWDHTAKVWDATNGQPLLTLTGEAAEIFSVAFSPDGQRIVTGSKNNAVKVWDAANGNKLLTLQGHSAPVWCVAFSPDGRWIASSSADRTAILWDAASGRNVRTLPGHTDIVFAVAFSPDSQRIVSASRDHTARIWEVSSGKYLFSLEGHSASVSSAVFSLDNQRIVTGSNDQTARVWDTATGRELITFKHGSPISSVALSPDGRRVVSGGGSVTDFQIIVVGSGDQCAKVWETSNDREVLTLSGHRAPVGSAVFSPNGQRIVTGGFDSTARVWDAASGKNLLTLQGHAAGVRSTAFSPDGQRIVTGSFDHTARVWDASTGQYLIALSGHEAEVMSVTFSPDGRRIATGGQDHTARIWEAASGKEILRLEGHMDWIWSVAFSPDGRKLVTGNEGPDQTATVWDTTSGKELLTLKGHKDWLFSAAFSPDGQRIVTGSNDRTAKVWDASTGLLLLDLDGHSAGVVSARFSPDGQRIVTASQDNQAKLWDAVSGKELLTLKGHSDWAVAAAFSPDGQRIVTASRDQTAKVWEAATARQVADWQKQEEAASERMALLRREETAATERERALSVQDPMAIKQWLVLAPIAFERPSGATALQQEQIPQEAFLRARSGERVKVGASDRVWRRVQLKDYLLDFNGLLGEVREWSVGYAVCYLQSDTDQTGLLMKVGSDDEAKVYLNGKEIYRCEQTRPYVPDQDLVAGVELKAGLNVLVLKVVNETRDWQASVRFTDAAGQPVKGIRVTLTP